MPELPLAPGHNIDLNLNAPVEPIYIWAWNRFRAAIESKFSVDLGPSRSRSKDKERNLFGLENALIACHPYRNVIAVSAPGHNCVHRLVDGDWLDSRNPLVEAEFDGGLNCITWSPTSDYLYIGVATGVCCFKIEFDGKDGDNNMQRPSMHKFLRHPDNMPVHSIAFSPQGRLFATATLYENSIYVWDGAMGTYSKQWALSGGYSTSHLTWSPSGRHLCMGVVDDLKSKNPCRGAISCAETYSWTHDSYAIHNLVTNMSWVGKSHLLYTTATHNDAVGRNNRYRGPCIYHTSMDPHNPVPSPLSNSAEPFVLDHEHIWNNGGPGGGPPGRGPNLKIRLMVTEPVSSYVAVTFTNMENNKPYSKVAVYLCRCAPVFTLTFIKLVSFISLIEYDSVSPQAITFTPRQPGYRQPPSLCIRWKCDDKQYLIQHDLN
jgi:hypothetical protein